MDPFDYDIKDGVVLCYYGRDEHVYVPDGVTEIGRSAFCDQEGARIITIPEGVKIIGDSAFATCPKLEEIDLPSTLTRIGGTAFCQSSLRSVTLPKSLKFIGRGAFAFCANLESIEYAGTKAEFNEIETEEHQPIVSWETKTKKVKCTDGFVELKDC